MNAMRVLMCSLSLRCDILFDESYTCPVQTVSAKTDSEVIFTSDVKANVMGVNIIACHLCNRE